MNSETIKACIAAYWRYQRQCPVVAFEAGSRLKWGLGEQADVLAVNKERYLIETEVKVSLSDLRKDKNKVRHRYFRDGGGPYPTAYFYFAVPKDIANQVKLLCDNLFTYAGVLGCPPGTDELAVEVYRNPRRLNGGRLSLKQIVYMARSQTATLCRLAKKVEEQSKVIQRSQKDSELDTAQLRYPDGSPEL